ncbi:MAG: ABC transporter permease [Longimicrobiales bacterium]|nr:ABC transporter permease [Longimicrobiales bacterium]
MTTLLQDLRYGLRMLAKAPVVSAVAALSLALGIAANASIFAVLNAFMFEPLPFRDQDGLVLLREGRQGETIENFDGVSVADFRDVEEAGGGLEAAMLYTLEAANLTGMDVPEQLQVVVGTPNLLDVLGIQPALGRGFRPEEGSDGLGNVLVLEHDFWQRRFLGDPEVLGRTLTVDGATFTVVGVMPESFDMIPANVDVLRPSDFAAQREDRTGRGYISFARLAAGATPATVERELSGVSSRLAAEYPETNRGLALGVIGAREFFPGPTDTKLTMILTAVTLFGLLIACANVANLLLGRAEERQKEVAVRTALGAGRQRILRQLLTESVTLGVVAGALGIGLAVVVVRWLQGMMPAELPKAMIPELDPVVLLATMAVAVLAGVAFGLAPALHATRGELREALGEGGRGGTTSRSRRRLRNAFVVGEFAVALGLLTGAAFLVEIFNQLIDTDPGFRQEGLLTFAISAPEDRFPEPADLAVYSEELLARLAAIPGVQGVAAMSSLPRGRGNPSTLYTVDGRPAPAEGEAPTASLQAVNPEYFSTMEIPLLQGRAIEGTDRPAGQPVVVVSQAFVEREFPNEDPLGRTVTFRGDSRRVVGVVADIVQDRIAAAGDRGEAFYVPLAQVPLRSPSFALRASGDPLALAADVRQAVWSVNPDQPIAGLRTLDAHVAESLAGPMSIYIFMTAMALIALALAAMGIYGVMAQSVAQQQREIGIRMALGAGRGTVVGMVTRSGLSLAGFGMLLGLPLAYLMYRGVASTFNLFEGQVGFGYAGGVTVALAAVAVLATWLPAQRASGVQPVAALRD